MPIEEKSAPLGGPQKVLKDTISGLRFRSSSANVELADLAEGANLEGIGNSVRLLLGSSYLYIYRDDITNPEHTHAKVQIGRFGLDEEGNLTEFVADSEDSLVSETFQRLGGIPFFDQAKARFSISAPDEESLAAARQIAEESNRLAAKQQADIDEIRALAAKNALKEGRGSLNIEEDELVGSVGQGEIGFLGEENKQRYLETFEAGPCIIITAYDPETKNIAMCHVDASTDENSVINQLLRHAGASEIRVFGGNMNGINQLVSIKNILSERGAEVQDWDVLNSTKSIIIDRETGKVFDVLNSRQRAGATVQDSAMMHMRALQGKQLAKVCRF